MFPSYIVNSSGTKFGLLQDMGSAALYDIGGKCVRVTETMLESNLITDTSINEVCIDCKSTYTGRELNTGDALYKSTSTQRKKSASKMALIDLLLCNEDD